MLHTEMYCQMDINKLHGMSLGAWLLFSLISCLIHASMLCTINSHFSIMDVCLSLHWCIYMNDQLNCSVLPGLSLQVSSAQLQRTRDPWRFPLMCYAPDSLSPNFSSCDTNYRASHRFLKRNRLISDWKDSHQSPPQDSRCFSLKSYSALTNEINTLQVNKGKVFRVGNAKGFKDALQDDCLHIRNALGTIRVLHVP